MTCNWDPLISGASSVRWPRPEVEGEIRDEVEQISREPRWLKPFMQMKHHAIPSIWSDVEFLPESYE